MDITNVTVEDANTDTTDGVDDLHTSEFDKFISAFEAEQDDVLNQARLAGEVTDEDTEPSENDSGEKSTEAEGNSNQTKPDDQKKTGEEWGVERIAAKEREFKDREAKFETERTKFLDEKSRFERDRQNLINPQALVDALMVDTSGTLAKLGVDSERVMKSLLYSKLPDDHPSKGKLREELRDMETRREMNTLKEQLAARDREAAQREEYNRTVTDLGKYVDVLKGTGEHEKEFPTVSKVARANSEYLNKRILREIVDDARERYLRGETGDAMSYTDAARRVEEDLSVLSSVLNVKPQENTKGSVKPETKLPSVTSIKPVPPSRPRKELTIEDLEERAIANAVAEFAKAETRRKGGYNGS